MNDSILTPQPLPPLSLPTQPDAFQNADAVKAGLSLHPYSVSRTILLQKLEAAPDYRSPLMLLLKEAAKPQAERIEIVPTPEEIAEALYVFTRPAKVSRAALARGRESFREEAMCATVDLLSVPTTEAVFDAVCAQFVAAITGR